MAESPLHADASGTTVAADKGQTEEVLPEVLQTPTRPISVSFRILFALANIVVGLTNVTIKQLLLPSQVAIIDPHNRITSLALIASIGAFAGIVVSPLSGALSDRTIFRIGRRRTWLIFGIVLAVIALVTMALSTTIIQLLVGEILTQMAIDTIFSTLTAIIPDRIPLRQRPLASAFAGMAPIVGGVIGLLLVTRLAHGIQQGYYLIAGVSFVVIVLFLAVFHEQPLPRGVMPSFQFKKFLADFWVNPRIYPDFAFTLLSRCCIFLCWTLLITYLLYFLGDVLHYSQQQASQSVATFQIVTNIFLIIAAVCGNILADKLQRIKPFVGGAALLMMAALFLIAFSHTWSLLLVAGVLLGIGFGVYLAVDITLAIRVLPKARNRAKDLGIINTAVFIPLILSPIIGAVVLNLSHSYTLLYGIAGVCALLAACFILPIKSVR